MDLLVISVAALLGLYMAWNIGANDVANSMADAVGSKALSVKNAVILAGLCEFAGAVLVGSHVTDTVRKGIVDPMVIAKIPGLLPGEAAAMIVVGMTAALLSAAFWLHFSSATGMPVSTTHSIVGAVAGFGIIAAGIDSVNWVKIGQIVASWFISPLAGGIIAYVFFKFITVFILGQERPVAAASRYVPFIVFIVSATVILATVYKGLKHVTGEIDWLTDNVTMIFALAASLFFAVISKIWVKRTLRGKETLSISQQLEEVEGVFTPLVIISSCSVAFAHGANDVANSVGPLAAVVHILQNGTIEMKVGVPFWILALGGAGIVLGLATYGHRVMRTVGTKITEITPSRGVAADVAATATVLVCTRMSLPVSTTHTLVGAIMGIGLARGLSGINRAVAKKIFSSWIITVPAAAFLAMILFVVGRLLFLEKVRLLIIGI
ncbi:MAG: inorganic phosphate transporter [Desulfurivibrionaceae bacterium]|nr:inorganic phosphate transporter [Desulfobulbales bacterium]MDT8334916.1 inorganic phosphate transporter [Desulfurivibrionaceae bacterium]